MVIRPKLGLGQPIVDDRLRLNPLSCNVPGVSPNVVMMRKLLVCVVVLHGFTRYWLPRNTLAVVPILDSLQPVEPYRWMAVGILRIRQFL